MDIEGEVGSDFYPFYFIFAPISASLYYVFDPLLLLG